MKEATGELNLTIIVVLAIGILIAFFYYTIWPIVNNSIKSNAQCNKAVCENPCGVGKNNCGDVNGTNLAKCYAPDDTSKSYPFYCPWKG